jgi:SAM-dependent methyltransferase
MTTSNYNASQAWKQALSLPGKYELHCSSLQDIQRLQKLGHVWKRSLQVTGIQPPAQLFELGCGGGIHLARLALNGFQVHGIDVSDAVAARAQTFLEEIRQFQSIEATIEVADIFNYHSEITYDMCFHFGVVEHFLEVSERQQIWDNLYKLTKPGGWILSVVPCGQHFMRSMVRQHGLAGYNIPEIDYSCASHRAEFKALGLQSITTLPHSFFSFLSAHPSRVVAKWLYPVAFTFGNLLLPSIPLPDLVKERWAQSLIVAGQKPVGSL